MKDLIRRIPLYGELVNAKHKSFKIAFYEIIVTTLFATAPIWFFPIFVSSMIKGAPSFGEGVYASIVAGDLYIYATALIGPLVFSITKDYASWGDQQPSVNASRIGKLTFEFPYGNLFFLISILLSAVAAICFGLTRFQQAGLITAPLNTEVFLVASAVSYLFALTCLFAVGVYRTELEDFSGEHSGTRDFLEQWKSRNG